MDQDTESRAGLSFEAPASSTDAPAERTRPARAPRARARSRAPNGDWIEGHLKSLYDAVAAEPLPAELQELIDKLRSEP